MTTKVESLPHTAISTWSGFVYQGKIALYHCLELMTKNYEMSRGLKLQLESQDDFAIFREGQCLSLHQVKAYKETLFSSYSAGIETQKKNALDRGTITAYFHVAREIRNYPDSFKKDYYPVNIYNYPIQPSESTGETKSYCPLDEVDMHIEAQINALIKATDCLDNWKINICTQIRETLEARINEKVIAVHHKIHHSKTHQKLIADEEFINFSTLCEVVEAVDYDAFKNEEYFLSRLQIDIGTYYQQFCELYDTQFQTAQAKLDGYLAVIITLDAQGMMDFLKATMPHRKGRFTTLSEFKDHALDRDSIRQGLFAIFHKLVQAEIASAEKIQFAWLVDDQFYYPTGIHTAAEAQDVICHDILEQALVEDVEFLFECGALITRAIDSPSITHVKFGADSVAREKDSMRGNNIISFKQMELVSLNNVPKELKDAEVD
ncbi:ABC-three component system protein [Oceanisphaera ostreae]|uniref:ABC-three component system protein n=1 Tax=Oceanisphaera ostreae TaxID=914151 RepID=A0ABW3KKN1_9GAMM